MQLTGALLTGPKGNAFSLRYIMYPAVGTVAAILSSMVIHSVVPLQGSVAALIVVLHVASMVQEAIWRMTLPAPIIASMSPYAFLQEKHASKSNVELLKVPSTGSPGTTISGAIVRSPEQFGRPPRFLVYLGGNGELWEHSILSVSSFARRVNAHAALFNYRGVGSSGGVTRRAEGMAVDAADVIKHLLVHEPGLLESDILLFGHSIGGGVASMVLHSTHPNCSVVFDRTFSSLPDAAHGIFSFIPLALIRPVLGAAFGTMDTASGFDTIAHDRKIVTYHRADRVINFEKGSLARAADFQDGKWKRFVVELRGESVDAHNSDMTDFEGSPEVLRRMMTFFRP